MEQTPEEKIVGIVKSFKSTKDWVDEVRAVESILEELEGMRKKASVRDLAKILNRTKSWVGVTLILMRGLRRFPEIEKLDNRYQAYSFIQAKTKPRKY